MVDVSADHRDAAGASVNCPPGDVEVTADGDRLRATWHPRRGVTHKALFRVVTDDGVAVLQHIREIVTRQSGGPSGCETRTDVGLDDVPRALRATARDLGFTLAEEGSR